MRAGFALGSNLGDRLANLKLGRDRLCERLDDSDPLCAGIYETQPVDCPDGSQPFLNTVIELETSSEPEGLLAISQAIEVAAGRKPGNVLNAPRELDIDILYLGDKTVETPLLRIPHPRLHERRFVLTPLAEIRPNLEIPGLPPAGDLLKSLPNDEPKPILVATGW